MAQAIGRPWGVYVAMAGTILLLLAWTGGLVLNVLWLGMLLHVPVEIIRRIVRAARWRLQLGWLRRPFTREHRAYLVRMPRELGFSGRRRDRDPRIDRSRPTATCCSRTCARAACA
jgi:hypothetical protein